MTPTEEARTRRIDAAISEATGADASTDLEAKILTRVADVSPQPSRRPHWLAAAAILLGSAIVFAVSGAHDNDHAAAAQDPKPVRVTTEDVTKGVQRYEVVFKGEDDVRNRLKAMGTLCEADFAMTDAVVGRTASSVKSMSANMALRTIAGDVGAPVAEFDGVVVIGVGQRLDPNKANVTMKSDKLNVRAFFKQLHARTGANFVVGNDVVGNLALDVKDVPWRDLLDVAAKKLQFRVIGHGSVLAITKRTRKVKNRVFFNFDDTDVAKILDVCTKISGFNIIIDAGVQGNLSLTVRNASSQETVRVAAACVGATVLEGEITRVVPEAAKIATTSLTAESCELAEELGKWIKTIPGAELDCDVKGSFAAFVDRANVRDLMRAVALATGHELYVDDDTFAIR